MEVFSTVEIMKIEMESDKKNAVDDMVKVITSDAMNFDEFSI